VEISQLRKAMDDNDTDMMSNIIEIQDIWNLLYKKVNHLRLDLIVTEKDLYIDRILLTRKETLNDYIYASNRGSGTYTARVTKKTLMWLVILAISLTFKSILPKETLDIFNYSGTSEIPKPKKIVLRVSRLVRVVNGKVKRISMF
jgi:hypothetical protein